MIRSTAAVTISFSLLASACAIKPIPDDVTVDSTFSIAKKVRCEMRTALLDKTRNALIESKSDSDKAFGARIVNGDAIGARLAELDRNPGLVYAKTKKRIDLLRNTNIAYKFKLIGTEINNEVLNAALGGTITQGLLTVGVQGGSARKRQNTRIFTLTDTFSSIFTSLDDEECAKPAVRARYRDWEYPITGHLGLYETVSTFIDLAIEADYKETTDGTFIDMIEFTTKFYGNAAPKIVLLPVNQQFSLTSVDAKPDYSREDMHQVAISLVIQKPAPSAKPGPRASAAKSVSQPTVSATDRALRNIEREENLDVLMDLRDRVEAE